MMADPSTASGPSPPSSCPEENRVRELLSGHLSDTEFPTIFLHLETCTRCQQNLTEVKLDSTLIHKLIEKHPELSDLIERDPKLPSTYRLKRKGDTSDESTYIIKNRLLVLGRYRIIEPIARGGFGQIYLGFDTELERSVAVKVPHRTLSSETKGFSEFRNEARMTARLRHPGIVPVYDIGETDDGLIYIISEFVEGRNLPKFLKEQTLNVEEAIRLVSQIAHILHSAHEDGLIHRDIKPSNILIDQQQQPRLVDFGLAVLEGSAEEEESGGVIGTPAFMSPEQARGDFEKIDRRTDIYSLGVVLFELLTGERPYQGKSHEIISAILNPHNKSAIRKITGELPQKLEQITLKAMAYDRENRYSTALELANELDDYLREAQAPAAPRSSSRLLLFSIATIVALLLAASGISTGIFSTSEEGETGTTTAQAENEESEIEPVIQQPPEQPEIRFYLQSEPPGAKLAFLPVGQDHQPLPNAKPLLQDKITPCYLTLPEGNYLVEAVIPGYGFHQVYRSVRGTEQGVFGVFAYQAMTIQDDGTPELSPINIPATEKVIQDLILIEGGTFEFGYFHGELGSNPPVKQVVPNFYISPTELTNGQRKKLLAKQENQNENPNPNNSDLHPVVEISFTQAVDLAERAGMRIPSEIEYEYVATNRGKTRFPWGNDSELIESWEIGVVGEPEYDRSLIEPQIQGLFSGVAEWTNSTYSQLGGTFGEFEAISGSSRVIRGGQSFVVEQKSFPEGIERRILNEIGCRWRHAYTVNLRKPGLGVRFVRDEKPRWISLDP